MRHLNAVSCCVVVLWMGAAARRGTAGRAGALVWESARTTAVLPHAARQPRSGPVLEGVASAAVQ